MINKARQKADDPEHVHEPFSYKKDFDEKIKMKRNMTELKNRECERDLLRKKLTYGAHQHNNIFQPQQQRSDSKIIKIKSCR